METHCAPLQPRRSCNVKESATGHDNAPGCFPSSQYFHIFGLMSSIRFWLSADALSTVAFCVDCPEHLSRRGMRVVKAGGEGWTVFRGRRIVLGVLSSDCRQKRTRLERADKQAMGVVTAGSEGAADESSPDCPPRPGLY